MSEKIRALFIFEILGKPADYIKDSLSKLVGELAKNKNIEVIRKVVHEPKEVEEKDNNGKNKEKVTSELYTTFAEVELIAEVKLILAIVLNMFPAHVEIIEPNEFRFKNFELSSFLTDLTVKIHKYDEVTKVLMLERNQLLRKLNELSEKIKNLEDSVKDVKNEK